ncbi:hypothetical protein [Agarivorans sp. 1_MG-2023]|uniref:hypothetical protein n=1 Tax=Agarivorans sp. 1_MG-2023 TaxID=3062634 RepID=UPI0026E14FB0|nr:hypothetical protein [Agarivorans sp. 1_MG-2023]MDO6763409.1 hypothetical protein [Agarivorans sp. 1_MG-2023]
MKDNSNLEAMLYETLTDVAWHYGIGVNHIRSFINGEGIARWERMEDFPKYEQHRVTKEIRRHGKILKPNQFGQVCITDKDGRSRCVLARPNRRSIEPTYFTSFKQ